MAVRSIHPDLPQIDLRSIKQAFIPINQTSLGRGLRIASSKSSLQACLLALIKDGVRC